MTDEQRKQFNQLLALRDTAVPFMPSFDYFFGDAEIDTRFYCGESNPDLIKEQPNHPTFEECLKEEFKNVPLGKSFWKKRELKRIKRSTNV